MIGPLLFAGMPPHGLGFYAREDGLELATRWVAIRGDRSDAPAQAAAVKGRGGELWLWVGPEATRHYNWQEGLSRLEAAADRLGAVGIIVNPELNRETGGWVAPDARAQFTAFARACEQAAKRRRVGMSSYPAMPWIEDFAREAPSVWATVQLYGGSIPDAEGMRRWYARWTAAFGETRVIPSIAGWPAAPYQREREGFVGYLSRVPKSHGAIAFDAMGEMSAMMREELMRYSPGGSPLGTFVLTLRAFLSRPAGVGVVATLAVLLVALVAAGVRYV